MHEAYKVSTRGADFVGLIHAAAMETANEAADGEVVDGMAANRRQWQRAPKAHITSTGAHSVGLMCKPLLGGTGQWEEGEVRVVIRAYEVLSTYL
jgi:hypothetical protein